MKRFYFIVFFGFVSTGAWSQKIAAASVPQAVKVAFQKVHPSAKPSWEMEDAAYEANFEEGGKTVSCVIDRQGAILETERSIAFAALPAAARDFVNQHYKGKKLTEVARIDKAGGGVTYEVNVSGTDVLFDSNGKRIPKPKEKNEKD